MLNPPQQYFMHVPQVVVRYRSSQCALLGCPGCPVHRWPTESCTPGRPTMMSHHALLCNGQLDGAVHGCCILLVEQEQSLPCTATCTLKLSGHPVLSTSPDLWHNPDHAAHHATLPRGLVGCSQAATRQQVVLQGLHCVHNS